jgi:AraC-like DNA-binding protein/ligand-binding sensor protein
MADFAKVMVSQLSKSQIFKDYASAFSEATRMPISFQPPEAWQLPQRGKKYENPFCALLAQTSRSCAMCLDVHGKLTEASTDGSKTTMCFAGLYETAVPVRAGNDILGYLKTGQVAQRAVTQAQFNKIAKQLMDWGVNTDLQKLEDAYFHTHVISQSSYNAVVRLLEVFAKHLSLAAEQIATQQDNNESPLIRKVKAFVEENKDEDISIRDAAKVVNISSFYFCKVFKKATGLTFTQYLSLVRIAKAKNLLLNPHLRVSEIAYEVGYQSLTHFNRVFRKLVGECPRDYRERMVASCKG